MEDHSKWSCLQLFLLGSEYGSFGILAFLNVELFGYDPSNAEYGQYVRFLISTRIDLIRQKSCFQTNLLSK